MAFRPVFTAASKEEGFVKTVDVEFQWFHGFAASQKQKSIQSLHTEYLKLRPGARILEVSTKSRDPLGRALSAFHLKLTVESDRIPVENVFQASKVFVQGGPFTDLLTVPPHAAKRDPRLRESGPLQSFQWQNQVFPLEPKTVFYDWLYLTALTENPNLAERLMEYDSFTDIEFNPEKSINCQAKSCALFVSLHREGYLTQVLNSPEDFIAMFKDPSPGGQLTLF